MPRPLPLFPLHLPTLMDTVTSDFLALSSTSPFVSSPLDDPSVSVSVSVSASVFPSGSVSSSDTAKPIPLPLQDIKTWPTLNLMHLTHLPAQLGVLSFDELDLYVCSSHGNFWIPTGVQTGPHPSALISHSEPLDATSGSFRTPTCKRPRELTPPSMRPSKIPHIDLTLDEPQVSPPSSPFQPLSPSPPTPAAS
ncbi:hypothetical protein CPB84DRAFT_1857841 [Gymnopilus junonius]|uniref:Uncharacterized protein n=1 Tax=Gymnopilus junonius TaxID=109634 RepID=A0A9P5N7M3_GYMJU|nr:hypothetical protein CPB84DRAFT_1857841 [Gymnopilus junonius]